MKNKFTLKLLFFVAVLAVAGVAAVDSVNKYPQFNTGLDVIKCMVPLTSSWLFSKMMPENEKTQKVCTPAEFKGFSAQELMQMDTKQVKSLPPSHFESLRTEQAKSLTPAFLRRLNRHQLLAFSQKAEAAMSEDCRKILKQIKKAPGPMARGIILTLSGLTAYILFKYS